MPKPKLPPLPTLRPVLPTNLSPNLSKQIKPDTPKRIPFFRDPGHTGSTRALYRCLLRSTKSPVHSSRSTCGMDQGLSKEGQGEDSVNWEALRRNIEQEWKKRKGLTSIPQTHSFLSTQRDLVLRLTTPTSNSELIDLSQKLAKRQTHADMRSIPPTPPKPYLAGYLRPTHFHPPLPRLKPQPISLTLMIKKRIAARARRLELQRYLMEAGNDIQGEIGFMRRLLQREGLDDMKAFWRDLGGMKEGVQGGYECDEGRKGGVFGEGVVRRVEAGKRRRQEWKRLRAGERAALAALDKTW